MECLRYHSGAPQDPADYDIFEVNGGAMTWPRRRGAIRLAPRPSTRAARKEGHAVDPPGAPGALNRDFVS